MARDQTALEMRVKQLLQPKWADQISIIDLGRTPALEPSGGHHCIGVGTGIAPVDVIKSYTQHSLSQVVQENSIEHESEINASAKMLCDGKDFANFPLSCILSPEDTNKASEETLRKYQMQFHRSDQKKEMLLGLRAYLETLMKRESTVLDVLAVADEIFSNAIYNAPFVNQANSRGQSRSHGVVTSERPATFIAGDNGTRLAMAAIDAYGSLDVGRLLSKIQRTYEEGADNTIQLDGDGGAGLGTYIVFESCLSLYLVVLPNEYTVVGVTMPISMSRKEKLKAPKNLHCIQIGT